MEGVLVRKIDLHNGLNNFHSSSPRTWKRKLKSEGIDLKK
jgi:hypothetical protein